MTTERAVRGHFRMVRGHAAGWGAGRRFRAKSPLLVRAGWRFRAKSPSGVRHRRLRPQPGGAILKRPLT
ncbi:hypothetical protein E1288_34905 [Saccharopolyspora elongata]|uniref:Uncharacterized protein n=1 Tax=Saccharopolyspora elongata TaxID=2530387 RepID=A0A4R4Y8D0_9PSEU|nr:hypothetical protein E1288_34905 [Saccharopolyspora elongata]